MANHINNWIEKAEPDWYTMFLKTWIPFNAWYFAEYTTKKDSEAIFALKTKPNKVYNRLISLLNGTNSEGEAFRFHLGQLHTELESRAIKNFKLDVSFKSIPICNFTPSTQTYTDKNGNIFKAIPSKNNGYRAVIADKSNKTLLDKTINPYNIDDLILDNQFLRLGKTMQKHIKTCFEKIAPNQRTDLITKSTTKGDYIVINKATNLKFINHPTAISEAIIEILYTLRCLLFHGELDPTLTNMPIYEHAYNIMKLIIKELK